MLQVRHEDVEARRRKEAKTRHTSCLRASAPSCLRSLTAPVMREFQ